mgnify:CR=1 FL=1
MTVLAQINNNLIIIYSTLSILFTLFFFLNLDLISSKLNIYDYSDKNRKLHKKKVPPIGGVIFFLIFSFYVGCILFFFESRIFVHEKHIIVLFITCIIIFLAGLIDDKINLSSHRKTIIFLFLISVLILNDNELILTYLKIVSFDKTFALGNISILFTIFCFFVFINAFNMYDGINLQSGLYLLTLFGFFLYKDIEPLLFTPFIFITIVFLFYNYREKIFLGNCGSYFLPLLISSFFIKSNTKLNLVSVEEIIILMMIPGLDLIRLFCKRIMEGKSPFVADRNHIHHILSHNLGDLKSVFVIFFITFSSIIIYQFLNSILILLFQIIIYLYLIIFFGNKKNKIK